MIDVDDWKSRVRSADPGAATLKIAAVLADRFNGSGSCQLTAEQIADAAQLTCDVGSVTTHRPGAKRTQRLPCSIC
jgi:hypothetical protein